MLLTLWMGDLMIFALSLYATKTVNGRPSELRNSFYRWRVAVGLAAAVLHPYKNQKGNTTFWTRPVLQANVCTPATHHWRQLHRSFSHRPAVDPVLHGRRVGQQVAQVHGSHESGFVQMLAGHHKDGQTRKRHVIVPYRKGDWKQGGRYFRCHCVRHQC